MTNDYYDALDLPKNATAEEIKRAYRRKAQKAHPDKGGNADEFRAVQKSYEVLSDPGRRAHYDRHGKDDAPRPENAQSNRFSIIANLFMHAISQRDDVECFDPLVMVRRTIKETIAQQSAHIQSLSLRITKMRKIEKRIRHKKKKDNLFLHLVAQQVCDAEGSIERCKHEVAEGKAMLEILDEYEYDYQRDDESKRDPRQRGGYVVFGNWEFK